MLLAGRRSLFSVSRVFMVAAAGLVLACGPSMRMIHESDTYYERCYAADVDPEISMDLRRQCWALWLEHYTPGQPPDRVAHAQSRLAALTAGVAEAPLPGSVPPVDDTRTADEALDGGVASGTLVTEGDAGVGATSPTASASAADGGTPPADGTHTGVSRPDSAEIRAGYRSPPPVRPTTACDPVCGAAWEQCLPRCDGRERSCRAACQAQYRACQAGCY